jgi:hypothetical protein
MLAPDASTPNEAGLFQDANVLGDGVERHRKRLGGLGHARFLPHDALQDRSPDRSANAVSERFSPTASFSLMVE